MNPSYATHLGVLKAVCDSLPNGSRIAEFGCGDASTPFLHDKYEHLNVISIEHRLEWFLRWSHLCSRWHSFIFCRNPMDLSWFGPNLALAFIDCDPGEARAPLVAHMQEAGVRIIVAHDTQPGCAPAYNWGNCFDGFKFKYVDSTTKPWTTVVSDTVDVQKICASIS